MPPRPQRSTLQQYKSASASGSAPAVNPFPVYRPPPPSAAAAAGSSSASRGSGFHTRRSPSPDPDRFAHFAVTAYEVDLVYGQPELARELEQRREGPAGKGRLVQHASAGLGADDEGSGEGVWVDRFSHLNLLATLPAPPDTCAPPSPASSWSSLPSDVEDTFFFSGDEGDDYERHKKRRRLDDLRAKRMEQIEPLEEPDEDKGDQWGGDDEVPSDAILTLMKHTFVSLSASPNPALLEMRILANHGADRRFEFLRGRYADAWRDIKHPPKAEPTAAIGSLLGGYESSEEESESGGGAGGEAQAEVKPESEAAAPPTAEETPMKETEEDAKKRMRREKARVWAEKRRAAAEN